MLCLGIRRLITHQSNGHILSTNFVATSSDFMPIMEQENDKETKKDFRRIVKLLERSPAHKRKKEQKEDTEKRKREEIEREETTDWKEHISKSLHKSYEDYAMQKNMESWKRRARRITFCYMRDRNLTELIRYTNGYMKELVEFNEKTNWRRTFEDNELVCVVFKFMMNELHKGNDVQTSEEEHTEKTAK